jgi:hypothetical protein
MRSRYGFLLALLLAGAAAAQVPIDPRTSVKVNFPSDSPLSLVAADWGETRATARGGALVLDLHTSLSLKNAGARRIRSVTLLVLAQEVTPGGKASVAVPSLNIGSGETFPVRVDLRLLRPLSGGAGPLVEVKLDGILFDDLSFFGPNRLNSRRTMTAWELEAQRDRKYFKSVLEARGAEGLRKDVLASLGRQADRPRLDVQMARGGRATAAEPSQQLKLAFLKLGDAPVEAVSGEAQVVGNEMRAPRLNIRNLSQREVEYIEIGWILEDRLGRQFLAGAMPAELKLAAGAETRMRQETSLRFNSRTGPPLAITGIKGYVSQVEFAGGATWIPSRASLEAAQLLGTVAPSAEEQRLTELYRKRGLNALVEELKKF